MAIVYMAINVVTGDRYIGATSKTLMQRRQAHKNVSIGPEKRKYNFGSAIRDYGIDNFTWTVLAEYKSYDDALAGEVYFIDKMRPEYNATAGGRGAKGVVSRNRKSVVCLEDGNFFPYMTLAAEFYDVPLSDVSESCKGKGRTAGGNHFVLSDDLITHESRMERIKTTTAAQIHRRRRNKTRVQNPIDGYHYRSRSRRVLCIDENKVFDSASEAARFYNLCKSAIIEMCLGQRGRKSVGGKRFMYFVGDESMVA